VSILPHGTHDLILLSDDSGNLQRVSQSKKTSMLRPTVYLGVKPHVGPKTRYLLLSVAGFLTLDALFDERRGLSFTTDSGPR
jgi:hypothetical protein